MVSSCELVVEARGTDMQPIHSRTRLTARRIEPTASEVRRDVVLCTTVPGFKSGDERILADLHQTRHAVAFLHDDRGRSLDQGFLGNPIEIPRSLLHIGAGLADVLPAYLEQGGPGFGCHRCILLRHNSFLHGWRGRDSTLPPTALRWLSFVLQVRPAPNDDGAAFRSRPALS